ncbi:unnamed protein product, partial [marine sediment metagenome]
MLLDRKYNLQTEVIEAENHFLNEHIDESTIDVILENIVVDISGITIISVNIEILPVIPNQFILFCIRSYTVGSGILST